MLQRIQQQAGFIEFSLLHFEEAQELFQEGELDVREVSYKILLACFFFMLLSFSHIK